MTDPTLMRGLRPEYAPGASRQPRMTSEQRNSPRWIRHLVRSELDSAGQQARQPTAQPQIGSRVPRHDLGHRWNKVLLSREYSIKDGMSIFHVHIKCLFKRLGRPGDDQI